ncbi:pseudouridine synthase [Persicitalea jodogahamensis]|uniref:Pseudouridine synthase n=1 Tax=Persicitalea jodogahamensis TaxID=402147 RepID=A0A8J3D6Z7_9BACT|nr:pseudouridine synthase [Persicitalea jodogahamensis]GHB83275.1 pseudouridine synthase [Persicitalea jodogahamensis]
MKKRNDFLKDPKFQRPTKEKPEWGEPKNDRPAQKGPAKTGGKKKYTRLSEAFPELSEGKKPRRDDTPKPSRTDEPKARRDNDQADKDSKLGRDNDRPEKKENPRYSSARPSRDRDDERRPRQDEAAYKPRRDDERKPRREESAYKPKRASNKTERVFNKPTLKKSDVERLKSPDYQPTKFERNRYEDASGDASPRRDPRIDRNRPSGDRARPGRRDVKSSDAFLSRSDDREEDRRGERESARPAREERSPRGSRPESKERYNPRVDRREQAEKEKQASEGESRRVGKFSRPPRYDFSDYEDKKPNSRKKEDFKKHQDDDVLRLNRYIANAGICSRREADELIASGQITVNGEVVTEMGFKVKRSDAVKYGKKLLNPEKLVYLLINKPKDYITTTEDPEERRTIMDLVAGACEQRIYPVGRLDRNTTGLLLLTNDGELAKKLTHPSSNIKKIYQVELDRPMTTEDFETLKEGVELEDGFIKPDELGIVTPDAMVVGIEIHSGKNRIVRRIFDHLGYEVQKLDRTIFAGLSKKDLPRGKWRFLGEKEVVRLKFLL